MKGEPITPKVKKQVIEGEYTEQKSSQTNRNQSNSGQASSSKSGVWHRWRPKSYGQWLQLILAILIAGLLFYVVGQARMQTAQVEAINRLQSQVLALHQNLAALESQQKSFSETELQFRQALGAVENRLQAVEQQLETLSQEGGVNLPEVDLAPLKQQVQALQQKLMTLSQQVLQALPSQEATSMEEEASQEVSPLAESSQDVMQQLEALGQQLKQQFEQKLQGLESQFKGVISNLSDKSDKTQSPLPLNAMAIQRWAIQINTQWQLMGNVSQTLAQLQALEQAVSASDLPNKFQLIKAIGQDQWQLKQYQKVSYESLPQTDGLRQWMRQLAEVPLQKPAESSQAKADLGQTEQETSPQQRLMDRFSQLFTVQKLGEVSTLTQAEREILREVLLQRGLLWVDQLDWALQVQDQVLLEQSLNRLTAFVQQYFPQKRVELETQLQPFASLQFHSRPSLQLVEAL